MLCSSIKKVAVCFPIICNLSVTTCISVNNVRADLFCKGIFITKHLIQCAWWLENNFKFTEVQVVFCRLSKRILSCGGFFPVKASTQISSLLETFSTIFFFYENFSQVLFNTETNKTFGITIIFKNSLQLVNFLMK